MGRIDNTSAGITQGDVLDDGNIDLVTFDSPFHNLIKNHRYLSDWSDDIIRIDGSKDAKGFYDNNEYIATINLNKIHLPPNRAYPDIVKLTTQRHLCDSYKSYINHCLNEEVGDVKSVTQSISRFSYFFCNLIEWMWLNNIYKFHDLTPEHANRIITDYSKGGLFKLLRVRERLNSFTARDDFKEIIEPHFDKRKVAILGDPQRMYCGINLSNSKAIPQFYYKIICDSMDIEFTYSKGISNEEIDTPPGRGAISKTISQLKDLYTSIPNGFDKPLTPLVAVSNTWKYAAKLCTKESIGTNNINVDDLALLLNTSLDYVYKYSEGIITAIEVLSEISNYDYSDHTKGEIIQYWYTTQWANHCEKYNLPFEKLSGILSGTNHSGENKNIYNTWRKDAPTFTRLIKYLSLSCFTLIGIMNGRRKDEIAGKQVGLYYGCLNETHEPFKTAICDFYIEKTVKDYVPIEVDKITVDCIHLLERLKKLEHFFQCKEAPERNKNNILFNTISPRTSSTSSLYMPDEHTRRDFFTHACKASSTHDSIRAHGFRRIAAILYMYRFEKPSLLAVRDMLFHKNISMTKTYVTDPDSRSIKQRIDELWPKEVKINQRDLEWARSEWTYDHILSLINGYEKSSGGFIKLIRRYMKMISRSTEFNFSTSNDIAKHITNTIEQKGHKPKTFKHGQCMSPDDTKNKTSRCYDQATNSLKKESANACLCGPCPYHFRPEGHLDILKSDLSELREKSKDITLPIFERRRAERDANNLEQAIKYSEKMQDEYSLELITINNTRNPGGTNG